MTAAAHDRSYRFQSLTLNAGNNAKQQFHMHSRYQPLAAAAEHALHAVAYCLQGNSNKSGPFY